MPVWKLPRTRRIWYGGRSLVLGWACVGLGCRLTRRKADGGDSAVGANPMRPISTCTLCFIFFISLLRKETDEVDILQRLLTLMTQLTQRRGVPVRENEEVKESQPPPSRRHSTVAHTTRPGGERYSSVARQAGLPQPSQRPAGRLASSSPGRAG
jgi:hypothetical protein